MSSSVPEARAVSRQVGSEFPGLELATAVEAVRSELAVAAEQAAGKRFQFEVGQIDLEFTVTMTRDSQARGGVKVWVLDMGAAIGKATQAGQKVKVTLLPKDMTTGGAPHISESSLEQAPR